MGNKRIQDLPAKGTTIAANDILELSEYQSPGVYISKKILGSELGGVTTFTALTDTPASYTGQTLKFVRVNAGETALEFATVSVSDTNIANTQLTLPTGTRKLIFGGANSTDILAFRNSTDTITLFQVKGDGAFTLGYNASSTRTDQVVIGYGASATGTSAVSIGENATGVGAATVSILGTTNANGQIAIKGTSTGIGAITIGETSQGYATQAIVIGNSSQANSQTVVVGYKTRDYSTNSITLGYQNWTTSGDENDINNTFNINLGNKNQTSILTSVGNFVLLGQSAKVTNVNKATYYDVNATNTQTVHNGTAPTTNITDAYQQYSADVVAGNAAPHFRTEAGDVIKLYKQASAGITTVGDLVTVLTNLGLLG